MCDSVAEREREVQSAEKILLVPDPVGVARSINRVQKSQTWLISVGNPSSSPICMHCSKVTNLILCIGDQHILM